MVKKFIAGGCSFTFGNELSDDVDGKTPSKKSWAHELHEKTRYPGGVYEYITAAYPGTGNPGIARRVFNTVSQHDNEFHNSIGTVVVMWSFKSRYDWAMPRHKDLEDTRWATISPWDTDMADEERHNALAGSEVQQEQWKRRQKLMQETGVKDFADAIYRHAANEYHEIYLSWKSIIWLQNILEKRKIPFMFTLADNSLFYNEFDHYKDQDPFMSALHSEIDLTKWFFFGERNMGFNQWALMEDYPRGTTHPLDEAHRDAVKLMLPQFNKIKRGGK
tara:strand:+ start:249 stop:1076 length:828 start_codon:yes stop_codon:yes gene_type:complete